MWNLAFIEHAQVQTLYAHLDRSARLGLFVPVMLHDGSGGRRAIQHWIVQKAWCGPQHILWTELAPTEHTQKRKGMVSSPILRQLYSRALFWLRVLKTQPTAWESLFERDPQAVYDDYRFTATADQVALRLKTQGVRVWVIYEAQRLDALSLEHMVKTWKTCNQQFAVILAAKLQRGQQPDEPLHDQLHGAPDAARYQASLVELKPIEQKEFKETVLLDLFDDLDADFSPLVKRNMDAFEERIWNYTQGHWDNTTLFATYLDDELGAKRANQTHRIITPEIVEHVFEQLMGISYVPGEWP
ncbi:MAG: hypothetical protein ACOCX5_04390 [Chloroflexota bacterium]